MEYYVISSGLLWQGGAFCVPEKIVSSYIRLASEYQLKALLLILSGKGVVSGREIAKALGCTEADAEDFMEFWVDEGVLSTDADVQNVIPKENSGSTVIPVTEKKEIQPAKSECKPLESVPVPVLSEKDIIELSAADSALRELLLNSQEVLGRAGLSHVERELIVNMATYYGLPGEIVLTILRYYREQKEKHKAVGTAYVAAMAKNWSEEGIITLAAADEKLKSLEKSDELWTQIVAFSGIRHRNPTAKQREMINNWANEFSMEMIELACDVMKENADKPTLKYVDGVLKNWHKKGIKTPADVEDDNKNYAGKKKPKKTSKLASKPGFDINEIAKKAMYDDNYDI